MRDEGNPFCPRPGPAVGDSWTGRRTVWEYSVSGGRQGPRWPGHHLDGRERAEGLSEERAVSPGHAKEDTWSGDSPHRWEAVQDNRDERRSSAGYRPGQAPLIRSVPTQSRRSMVTVAGVMEYLEGLAPLRLAA